MDHENVIDDLVPACYLNVHFFFLMFILIFLLLILTSAAVCNLNGTKSLIIFTLLLNKSFMLITEVISVSIIHSQLSHGWRGGDVFLISLCLIPFCGFVLILQEATCSYPLCLVISIVPPNIADKLEFLLYMSSNK